MSVLMSLGSTRRSGARSRILALHSYAVLALAFLYLPILVLFLFAFNDATAVSFPLKGFTTQWFERVFASEPLHEAVLNSIKVGLAASLIATGLGLCAARASTRFRWTGRKAMTGFIMLPMVLPEILLAVALMVVALQLGVPLSLGAVTAAHVLICTPFAISVLTAAFEGLDRSLEEASLDLGESALTTFFRVTLPLVAPGIASSLLLTFTISLDDFILSFFLSDVSQTLPLYMWGRLRFPQAVPEMLALGTLLVLVSLVLLLAAEGFRRRSLRRTGPAQPQSEPG